LLTLSRKLNMRLGEKSGILLLILLIFGFYPGLIAQPGQVNYSEYNWLFGNSTSTITFNKSDARAQLDTIQATPYGTGGGAVITDPTTGDLIFYTDGQNIYDVNHQILPNGAGLSADITINQAAVIYPFSYSVGQYYIFTNPGSTGPNEIQYTIVDKNLPGNAGGGQPPRGDAVGGSINLGTGLTNPADAMIMIQRDIDNYWLISSDRITDDYQVLEINSGVLGAVQTFALGTPAVPAFEPAAFAYHADSSLLAVAPKDANRNVVLLDFDINTGALSLNNVIVNSGNGDTSGQSVYDIEWSRSGNKLYISRFGDAGLVGNLYQYDLNDTLNNVNAILFQSVFRSLGLQRGPDQNIYHLYQQTSTDAFEIGVLLEADSAFSADSTFFNVGYDSLAFVPSNIDALQFPAFAAPHFEVFDTVGFAYIDTCAERSTKFFSHVKPTPSSYLWDFGDGQSSNAVSPVYTYAVAATYTVTLTATLNGIMESFASTITISQNDLMVDLGMDTVRCPGEIFTYDAGDGGASYAWNTGESTQTIDVDTTGTFSVAVVSAATGCLNYAFVQVVTYQDSTQFSNQWYFGEMAGIDFNPQTQPTVAITDANLMNSPAASSSVSDLNGNLLFYTNGVTVWNRNHEIMSNGDNIGGDSTSTQGTMIVPLPGDTSIYYIFTSDPVYGDFSYDMRYSVVDMRLDTAKGEVVAKDLFLFQNSTERMTGSGFGANITWLVTHEFGSNTFRSYPITAAGIGAPVTSSAGSVQRIDEEKNATGQMQYARAGGVIALAYQDTNDNFVELFEVNPGTGFVDGLVKINIQEAAPSQIYGVDFSSSLLKLYVTTNGNGSNIIQYDLDSLFAPTAEADIAATKFILGQSATLSYGALQTGPDQIMYMAVDNQTAIGNISGPNSDNAGAQFDEAGFDLVGRTSRLGLPNFTQTLPLSSQQPGISFVNACLGQETEFTGTGTSIIDTHIWSFGDGGSAVFPDTNTSDTTRIYNLEGTYNVTLNLINRCGLDITFVEAVDVFAIPAEPTVLDAVTLCNGPITLEAWPVDTTFTYTWSTGDTTRAITVDQPNIINVFLTNSDGCNSNPRDVFIDDTRPLVDLGVDRTICENTVIADLDGQNPGALYTWTIDGTNTLNVLRTQTIDTSLPGSFVYSIQVEDILNCVATDSVTININNIPDYATTPTGTSGCGASDGQIQVNMNETGSFTYELTGPINVSTTTVPSGGIGIAGLLSAGTYDVILTNTLTGCVNTQIVDVEDGGSDFLIDTVTPTAGCTGQGSLDVLLAPDGGTVPANVTFILTNQTTGLQIIAPAAPLANAFQINNLDSGVYTLEIRDITVSPNCVQTSSPINLGGNPLADFSILDQNICGDEGDIGLLPITIDPGISYNWSGPDIIGSTNSDTVRVGSAGVYTVTSSGAGLCEVTQPVNVTQDAAPIVQIDIVGNACDGSLILQANVTNGLVGNGSYLWGTGSQTSQITVTSSDTYDVFVLDQGTGCTGTTALDVDVFSEITVFIAADPDCDDNSAVFLSAFSNITEDVSFFWTDPNGDILSDTTSAEILISQSGTYSVIVASNVSTCDAMSTINTLVIPITDDELLLPTDTTFCSLDSDPAVNSVILDPGMFSSYEWAIANDGIVLSTNRLFTVTEGNVYEVTITNGFTCIRDFIDVRDDCLPRIVAPNAFTPNGNGQNDEFFVYPNPYVTAFSISIYSRWGELVFESNDMDFRWDGIYRNTLLTVGSYVYVMRFTSSLQPEQGTIEQHGGVILLR